MKLGFETVHCARAINYLDVCHLEVVPLINFGTINMEDKRFEHKKYKNHAKQYNHTNQINHSSEYVLAHLWPVNCTY